MGLVTDDKVITVLPCDCGCGKDLGVETAEKHVRVRMKKRAVLDEALLLNQQQVVELIDGLRRWLELGSDSFEEAL